ncbi:MAG TPA: hypothetical protein VGN09_11015, partial [Vicinamibacteria bacterium]
NVKNPFLRIAYACVFGVIKDVIIPEIEGDEFSNEGKKIAFACAGGAIGQGFELAEMSKNPFYGPLIGVTLKIIVHVTEKFAEGEVEANRGPQ